MSRVRKFLGKPLPHLQDDALEAVLTSNVHFISFLRSDNSDSCISMRVAQVIQLEVRSVT